jgi:hypothetical protein
MWKIFQVNVETARQFKFGNSVLPPHFSLPLLLIYIQNKTKHLSTPICTLLLPSADSCSQRRIQALEKPVEIEAVGYKMTPNTPVLILIFLLSLTTLAEGKRKLKSSSSSSRSGVLPRNYYIQGSSYRSAAGEYIQGSSYKSAADNGEIQILTLSGGGKGNIQGITRSAGGKGKGKGGANIVFITAPGKIFVF